MHFSIKKYIALFALCTAGATVWAASPPADPIFDKSEGCVQSPLPSAPRDATTIRYAYHGAPTKLYDLAFWFQPCTLPNSTLPYPAVLLMQATPVSGGFLDAMFFWGAASLQLQQDGKRFSTYNYINYVGDSSGDIVQPSTFLVRWLDSLQGTANVNPARPVSVITFTSSDYDTSGVERIGIIPTTSGSDAAIPAANYAGAWWSTTEGGHGLVVTQDSANYLWLTWYGYDDRSEPLWYVSASSNQWVSPTQMNGVLMRTRYNGSNALTGSFNANLVSQEQVGTFSLNFTNFNNAVFSYTVNGKTLNKNITRFNLH